VKTMIIYKVFNNNAVVIKDENGVEKVVMGCGLAFKKKNGDELDESKIDKIFVLSDPLVNNRFQELVASIPIDYVEFGEEIIEYAAKVLEVDLNDTIYLSLIDHLHSAVRRFQEGIGIKNAILWDIRKFYKKEFEIGLKALDMIEKRFSLRLPEDEAGFIAIHFVEAVTRKGAEDIHQVAEIISEITNIVSYNFHIFFNEESLYYFRFITHLKFFAQRLLEGKTYLDDEQDDLLQIIRKKYVNAYECAEKICEFLKKKYKYNASSDELLYLTLHIERVVYKTVL
jgi:beta-glucoside operon transcriptional antiterminator